MSKFARSLRELIHNNNVPHGKVSQAATIVTARAVAYSLPIPTSPVENLLGYYEDQHRQLVGQAISEVNEHLILDTVQGMALTKAFWMLRYRLVHEPNHPSTRVLFIPSLQSQGAPDGVDELLAVMNANDFGRLAQQATQLYQEGE